jgi:hypothetical protein
LSFDGLTGASYYIVIRHRNHLAIMSANPVANNANSLTYDFTTGQDKCYGSNAMNNLSGVYGMIAGDGNGNGSINATDRNSVWRLQNGNVGYLSGDFNLNGSVSAVDRNNFWRANNGKVSQVPPITQLTK